MILIKDPVHSGGFDLMSLSASNNIISNIQNNFKHPKKINKNKIKIKNDAFICSLVGCCLWGRTESDTTEATEQQQQWIYNVVLVSGVQQSTSVGKESACSEGD